MKKIIWYGVNERKERKSTSPSNENLAERNHT